MAEVWGTVELLEAARCLLLVAEKPLSIREMVVDLRGLGAFPAEWDDKKCDHWLYCKMWYHVKRAGDKSYWHRVGRSLWCATEHLTIEHVLQEDKFKQRTLDEIKENARLEGRKPREKAEPFVFTGNETCGDCRFISYHGVHQWSMQSGHCDNETKSGKPYTIPSCAACPHFAPRSREQRAADKNTQRAQAKLVEGINSGARTHGKKRRENGNGDDTD